MDWMNELMNEWMKEERKEVDVKNKKKSEFFRRSWKPNKEKDGWN